MDTRRMQAITHHSPLRGSLALAVSALLLLSACGGTAAPTTGGDGDITVFGAYATQIEEPWDGVIHSRSPGRGRCRADHLHLHR